MRETKNAPFQFKQFSIEQDLCAMKVGTDGVLLGAWAPVEGIKRALDIGAGTGVLALMLAQRQPSAEVIGVEVDEQAASQAKVNVANSPFSERVVIEHLSIQSYAQNPAAGTFGLIVSNPPFFTGGVLSDNQERASVRHTVKLSHQDLLRSVQRLLSPTGKFCTVLPLLEGLRFEELAATYQFHLTHKCEIRPRIDKPINRLLLQFEKQPAREEVVKETFSLFAGATGETRSERYIELTRDFYLEC